MTAERSSHWGKSIRHFIRVNQSVQQTPLHFSLRSELSSSTQNNGAGSSTAPEEDAFGYKLPPKDIADLVDAPDTPDLSISPSKTHILLLDKPTLPPIELLAMPEVKLAGLRINPRTHSPSRAEFYTGMALQSFSPDPVNYPITGLPENFQFSYVRWSTDGKYVAFAQALDNGLALWVLEVATGQARRLTGPVLNCVLGTAFFWLPGTNTIVLKVVPDNKGPYPEKPLRPSGPVVQVSDGRKAPVRTYQDMLKSKYDEDLFDWFLQCQVYRIDVTDPAAELTPIGEQGTIRSLVPSPNAEYLLFETLHRPYSYIVPSSRFPRRIDLRSVADGSLVRTIADLPLMENIPVAMDATADGPRGFQWRDDAPATLVWVEAQDKGDPAIPADIRDIIYMTEIAPGEPKPPQVLARLALRYDSITWCDDQLCLVSESWWKTRRTKTYMVNPTTSEVIKVIFDRQYEDRYKDPGSPVQKRLPNGNTVLMLTEDRQSIYLAGDGASPEGDRPFIDIFNLETGATDRVWQSSEPGVFESPVMLLENEPPVRRLVTRRERVDAPPNFYFRDLETGTLEPLTNYPHPYPHLAECTKELIRYERADGVKLNGTLYLPPGYDAQRDGPLPTLLWAYPREYKSLDAAGQVNESPYRFVRLARVPLYWLTQGYAILDNPAMPIVAEGTEEPNDTFLEQLVAGAKAAVDELVRRGVTDRDRVAVGGHSYGAFMAAHLLANSNIFRTAICRSGAYNRTLTPFGFQYEERSLWDVPHVYAEMSPFLTANKIKDPILLIHGEADNNAGTLTMQSERYFQALKGHGANVRLVLLPHESHGYRARESVMHTLWEMSQWLDTHVKNAPPRSLEASSNTDDEKAVPASPVAT